MATSVLAVLSLATMATLGAAMIHGSTTTLEITATDKDTGSWMAKMGDTKVAVEHKHLDGNIGSGEWTLKLSQSSDMDKNNDIYPEKSLQQRDTAMDDSSDQTMGNQMIPQQDSYLISPAVSRPISWEFQQRALPETLSPPGVYQDSSYFPTRLESLSAPDTILRPPPALPPYSYSMIQRQTQPLSYPYASSFAPNRIERGFMSTPLQPYNTLRYESEFPSYNVPTYDPTFDANRLERRYINDVIQPNAAQQSYLWEPPGVMTVPLQQDVPQQDSYMPGAFAGQQNYFPQNALMGQVPINRPINDYQYPALIPSNAEELSSVNQNTGNTEYSREVPESVFNSPNPVMMHDMQNQRVETGMPFLHPANSMLESINAAPEEQLTTTQTNDQTSDSVPEHSSDSGYASDANTEQKFVIVEALVVPNSETASVQELSRGDNADQPLSYAPDFAPGLYREEIEGLRAPQPLPLLVNERMQDAPKLTSDYSAPSYGMAPPPRFEQRNSKENEVMPEYKEVQDYHPYVADIAFRPIQETDSAISYMPTSIQKEEGTAKIDTTTPEVLTSTEKQK